MSRLPCLAAILTLAGCTMTGERTNADGTVDHQIVCGSGAPWSVCESRAAEICGGPFDVLSKTWSINGSELWARCHDPKVAGG